MQALAEEAHAEEVKAKSKLAECLKQVLEKDREIFQLKKDLEDSQELCGWYEKEPYKAAGLKKCNKCKRFTWHHSDKCCLNLQCPLNLKIFAEKQAQTGEEEDVIEDSMRFEEVPEPVDTSALEHEERMRRWREENDKDPDGFDEEPTQKRPRSTHTKLHSLAKLNHNWTLKNITGIFKFCD